MVLASADEVLGLLGVTTATGLPSACVAELMSRDGPNALPEETPPPEWRRFLDQYRTYMQIILLVAAVVTLAIKEWSTATVLILPDIAKRGCRPSSGGQGRERYERSQVDDEGERQSAPRWRPNWWCRQNELVVGDIVLLAAGDQVPADGRIRGCQCAPNR